MYSTEVDVSVLPTATVYAPSPRRSIESFEHLSTEYSGVSELPRAASSADVTRDGAAISNGLKRTYSENILALPPDLANKSNSIGYVANKELFRRASRKAKNKLGNARFSLPADNEHEDTMRTEPRQQNAEEKETARGPGRSVTGTIRSIARKSFLSSTSRSPSPAPTAGEPKRMEKKRSRSPFTKNAITVTEIISVPAPVHSRSTSRSSQMSQDGAAKLDDSQTPKASSPTVSPSPRRMSFMSSKNKSETDLSLRRKPSSLSLRSRSSVEHFHTKLSSMKVPPIPTSLSSDRLSSASFDTGRKKDPLWAAFRALDGDYIK
jgi:hypothetical protein